MVKTPHNYDSGIYTKNLYNLSKISYPNEIFTNCVIFYLYVCLTRIKDKTIIHRAGIKDVTENTIEDLKKVDENTQKFNAIIKK